MNDKFCEPRFEQGIWYPILVVGCSVAGTTQSFTSRLERCTGSTCGTFVANSAPVSIEFPLALESGCKEAPVGSAVKIIVVQIV